SHAIKEMTPQRPVRRRGLTATAACFRDSFPKHLAHPNCKVPERHFRHQPRSYLMDGIVWHDPLSSYRSRLAATVTFSLLKRVVCRLRAALVVLRTWDHNSQ